MPSLYDFLEVSQSASQQTIVGAYKRLHAQLSTRINGIDGADRDTLDRMSALREAFNTLSDPERRHSYDMRLVAGRNEGLRFAEEPPRLFLKPLLFVVLIASFGASFTKIQSEQEKARQEWEQIVADARMADMQVQQERERKRAVVQANLEHRRDEAMARFSRKRLQDDLSFLEKAATNKIRS